MNKISKQLIKIASMILSYNIQITNEQKEDLKRYVQQIRNEKQDINTYNSFFYTILTRGKQGKQLTDLFNSYSKQQKEKYYQYINQLFPINNGAWAQINFNKELSHKTDGKTYNYYISIQFPTKEQVNKYINSLYYLMQETKKLSDNKQCYIGFKTHARLSALLGKNDTLKFYYYDNNKNIGKQLQALVNNYISKYNLKRGTRLYDHGLDVEDDKQKSSFGDRCSEKLTQIFIKWVKDNKNNYSNQQFVQSFQRDLKTWISNIAKKLI